MYDANVRLTHIVYQVNPEGISTECRFYNCDDAGVRTWLNDMRRDNPDHTYTPVQL